MYEYRKSSRYKLYRFVWINANKLGKWAGKQMIKIAKEYDK